MQDLVNGEQQLWRSS